MALEEGADRGSERSLCAPNGGASAPKLAGVGAVSGMVRWLGWVPHLAQQVWSNQKRRELLFGELSERWVPRKSGVGGRGRVAGLSCHSQGGITWRRRERCVWGAPRLARHVSWGCVASAQGGPVCGRPEPPPCLHRLVLCIASEQGESLARTLQICIAPRASPACAGLRGSLRLPGFL